MAIEIIEHNSFGTPVFQKNWDSLSEGCESASLFTTRLWCQCWADTLGQDTRPVILEAVNEAGTTVGILPLCVDTRGPVRWLKFMGRDRAAGDYLDLLAAPEDHDACLDAILAHIDAKSSDCDGLQLGELGSDSSTLRRFESWANDRGCTTALREKRLVMYVDLPATFDEFLANLKRKTRYHVRCRRRGLADCPDARMTVLDSVEDVEQAMSEFFALHQLRWQSEGLPGLYHDGQMREFLTKFCRLMAAHDGLRVFRLAIEDQPQAVLISFHWKGVAHFYQTGRHPACPIKSPGSLVIAESIEQAIREGLKRYDFLRGDETYKFFWTLQSQERATLVIGQRWPAKAAMAAETCKDGAKQILQKTMGEAAWEKVRNTLKGDGQVTPSRVRGEQGAKT